MSEKRKHLFLRLTDSGEPAWHMGEADDATEVMNSLRQMVDAEIHEAIASDDFPLRFQIECKEMADQEIASLQDY